MRILSAITPDAPLSTVLDVMAMLGALPEDGLGEIREALVPVIVDLVRHGLVLPAELLGGGDDDAAGDRAATADHAEATDEKDEKEEEKR